MSKTLKNTKRQDKEQLKAIRFTQNSIPLEQFYEDGIFLIQSGKRYNKYSATYQLQDISYLTLSDEMQKQIFFAWSAVLNALDPGTTNKISVIKHKISSATLERFMMHSQNPQYEKLQTEYNRILKQRALQGNGMIQEV